MDPLAELRRTIARHAGAAGPAPVIVETPLAGVRLAVSGATTAPGCDMVQPTFALVVQGAKRTVVGDRVFTYGAGQYLVATAEVPVTGAITRAPFAALVLHVDPAAVAALLLQTGAEPRASVPDSGSALAAGDAGPALLGASARLLGLLDAPRDAAALAPLYQREILWRLISGEHGPTLRRIGLPDSRLTQISRALHWIRTNYDQQLQVDDLAARASMSVSSFHRHFRAVTHMTPIQYQKHLRLQEARALLTATHTDVADAGHRVGYDSPSQFSREYKRMFGVSPSRDGVRS